MINIIQTGEDETEVDTTEEDLLVPTTGKRQHKNGPIVRLKKRDMYLYGNCAQTDQFSVVVCRFCRMVLKPNCLKSHIDRKHHEKERKHELSEAVVKIEKLRSSVERAIFEKTSVVTEKFDKIVVDSKIPSVVMNFTAAVDENSEKTNELKRNRHFQRKSTTPSENSNDAVHIEASIQAAPATTESSSASNSSNSPQSKRRKRKRDESIETFHSNAAPASCHIIVEPQEIVIRDASSPPPLAPITNEPSVWIVTPSPTIIVDGSFVVKPLEQESEPEIDLKDLKVLKPLMKETIAETTTLLTPSNWYSTQPRPLAVNTFNLRKLNAQRYVMATQRKLIELGRNLRTEEKVVGGKAAPKTWSFIERGVSFIPFRVTH